MKLARKQRQEANVKKKTEAKEEHIKKSLEGMKKKKQQEVKNEENNDSGNDDDTNANEKSGKLKSFAALHLIAVILNYLRKFRVF